MIIPTAKVDLNIVKEVMQHLDAEIKSTSTKHFQSTPVTLRKTLTYGYDYFGLGEGDKTFAPIPSYIQELCQACIDAFGRSRNLGTVKDYRNVIISIYQKGYRLEAHADVTHGDKYSDNSTKTPALFYFGEDVLGVVLEADSQGKLYFVRSESNEYPIQGEKLFDLDEQAGLAYILCGTLRKHPYYHGVSEVEHLRVSVTFRTVIFYDEEESAA